MIVLGTVLAVFGYGSWEKSERALRLGSPLGYSGLVRLLAVGVARRCAVRGGARRGRRPNDSNQG